MASLWLCTPSFSSTRIDFPILRCPVSESPIFNIKAPRLSSRRFHSSYFPCCSFNSISGSSIESNTSPSTRVYIKGLAKSTTEGTLRKAFSRFGEITRLKVIVDERTKQSLGFGHVWFSTEESADLAVKEMNGKVCSSDDSQIGTIQAS